MDKTVVVGMSGGVDSSVAAALLVEQGFDVKGVMLRLWNEPGREDENRCCAPDAMARARRVAAQLGIPFYVVDVQELFHRLVVQHFIDEYKAGSTPNPCLVCNKAIRWGFLREQALAMGASFFATGHYARIKKQASGKYMLMKSNDPVKDQSYVLAGLNQEQLAGTLLPLGEFTKSETRDYARKLALKIADQPDSQDLCFIADGDYRGFLSRNSSEPTAPGFIVNRRGDKLGEHFGLSNYTIGQRKGLGISSHLPLYVLEKDPIDNLLVVGLAEELGHTALVAGQVNWISGQIPSVPFKAQVKVRYKAQEQAAFITLGEGGTIMARFELPIRDITPGQSAVIYDGDVCLGSGTILRALN